MSHMAQSYITDNLQMPNSVQCMSLEQGSEPEYPEKTPETRGEHADSKYTEQASNSQNPRGDGQTC